MRANYKILWLDDDFANPIKSKSIKKIVNEIKQYLEDLGYISDITYIKNEGEAKQKILSNEKIDLFISDYNIDDTYKGIDFLKDVRKKYLQEMILYSNVNSVDIKNYLIENIQNDAVDLQFMTKFTFHSTTPQSGLVSTIKQIIDLTLLRWQELNALRGFCLAETSQVEENIRNYLKSLPDMSSLLSQCDKNIRSRNSSFSSGKNRKIKSDCINIKQRINRNAFDLEHVDLYEMLLCIFDVSSTEYVELDKVRYYRNGFAHIKEDIDANGKVYIELKNGDRIFENDITDIRKLILKFVEIVSIKFSLVNYQAA